MPKHIERPLNAQVAYVLSKIVLICCFIATAILSAEVFSVSISQSYSSIGTKGFIETTGTLLQPSPTLVLGFFSLFLYIVVVALFWWFCDGISKKLLLIVGFSIAALYMIFLIWYAGTSLSRGDANMCWLGGQYALEHNKELFNAVPQEMEVDHNWSPAIYFSIYPFQCGLVVLSEVLYALFGVAAAPIAMRILNAGAILFITYALAALSQTITKNEKIFKLTFFLAITCWPLINFVTYLYGNILGLGLVLGFVLLQAKAFSEEGRRRLTLIALSAIPFIIGINVKTTHILFGIALVCVWIVWGIQNKSAWPALITAAIVIVANMSCLVPQRIVESQVDMEFGAGMPKTSWIEMGIDPNGSGMYSGEQSYDYAQSIINPNDPSSYRKRTSIPQELGYWFTHPFEACSFFGTKLSKEWCEPDFDSLSEVLSVPQSEERIKDRDFSLTVINIQNVCRDFYDGAQTIIAIAACVGCFFMFRRRTFTPQKLILPACFLIGFFVFLLWEGKPIYVFPFWLCLLPIAAYGFNKVLAKIKEQADGSV